MAAVPTNEDEVQKVFLGLRVLDVLRNQPEAESLNVLEKVFTGFDIL